MSRTKRRDRTRCKEIRTHLHGNELSDKDREYQDADNYLKGQTRKYKSKKRQGVVVIKIAEANGDNSI